MGRKAKIIESTILLEPAVEQKVTNILNDMPDPDKAPVTGQLSQNVPDRLIPKVDPTDNALDSGVRIGQLEKPTRFLDRLAGLDGNGSVEVQWSLQSLQIGGQPIPLKGASRRYPWVFFGGIPPEMLMGINFHGTRWIGSA
jgi:hypothetical protein